MSKLSKPIFLALLVVTVFFIGGCASIVSKSSYPISITSSPEQADYIVTNKKGEKVHSGKTPSTVTLKSGAGFFQPEKYKITFTKDGYSSTTSTISAQMDGWYIGNVLFGGLIGILIVDPATGAMWRLPDTVSTTLYENKSSLNITEKNLHVLVYDDVPQLLRSKLIKIAN